MAVANTQAHYDTAKFTAMKSFVVQAPGACTVKHYKSVICLKNDKFCNKLTSSRLEKLGHTNTLAYYVVRTSQIYNVSIGQGMGDMCCPLVI